MYQKRGNQLGFTALEVVIMTLISSLLMAALLRFLVAGYPLYRITYLQQRSTESARLILKRMTKELREARPSDTGAYPLIEMSPQRVIFYSDLDRDDTTERVRYELSGTDLIKGITEPTGDPLVYDTNTEVAKTIVSSIRNDTLDIFTYYNGDYPDDQTPLTPVDLTEVKYIQYRLLVDVDTTVDPPPIDIVSQVQLRNLKTNLGETTNP